jgi:hypothetical protein
VDDTPWQQININYPARTPQEREQHAIHHLGRALPAAETAGLITAWWVIRKGAWRIRYLPTEKRDSRELARKLITDGAS